MSSKYLEHIVELEGRDLKVELTRSASDQLSRQDGPLKLEMELYFSCMIRKKVRIRQSLDTKYQVSVSDKLEIGFRTVMTKKCSITDTDEDGRPPLTDFPIKRPDRYIPHWLTLDYRKGEWLAEFGYLDMP